LWWVSPIFKNRFNRQYNSRIDINIAFKNRNRHQIGCGLNNDIGSFLVINISVFSSNMCNNWKDKCWRTRWTLSIHNLMLINLSRYRSVIANR
jgi:hypothetical protein